MATAYLNGKFIPANQARISPFDRGFLFGDGVYEVVPVYHGQSFRLTEHLHRLQRNLDAVEIPDPYSFKEWETLVTDLIEKNNGGDQTFYLQVTRGAYESRSHLPLGEINPTVFMTCFPLQQKPIETLATGVKAITLDDVRWQRCDIKSVSLLGNVLTKLQAEHQGADEALILNNGFLQEGSLSNIFVVKENKVFTSPKSAHLLGGVTRELVIELLKTHHIPIEEVPIPGDTLNEVDEIWSTSSTREIVPVTHLNDKPIGTGKAGDLWRKTIGYYRDYLSQLAVDV